MEEQWPIVDHPFDLLLDIIFEKYNRACLSRVDEPLLAGVIKNRTTKEFEMFSYVLFCFFGGSGGWDMMGTM